MELENIVANTVYLKAREGKFGSKQNMHWWVVCVVFWRKLDQPSNSSHFLYLFAIASWQFMINFTFGILSGQWSRVVLIRKPQAMGRVYMVKNDVFYC